MKEERIKNILKMCVVVAENSKCTRRKFGAVLTNQDGVQLSGGYNGSVRGSLNCGDEIACLKDKKNEASYQSYNYCPAVHAEVNAILNAARIGVSVVGSILFLNSSPVGSRSDMGCERPCLGCRRVIINSGVKEIYFVDKEGTIIHELISSWIPMENRWMENVTLPWGK